MLRLLDRVFGSSSLGAGGVDSCGACAISAPALDGPASAAPASHECHVASGEVHHLRNELSLTCMAQAYGHGAWLAEAVEPADRAAFEERIQRCTVDMYSETCACADQGLLTYCNRSTSCRAHLSALTVAYHSTSLHYRTRRKAALNGMLERWFGALVESKPRNV